MALLQRAERILSAHEEAVASEHVLLLVSRRRCCSYDCEFVAGHWGTASRLSDQRRRPSRSGPAWAMAQAPSWLGSGSPAPGSR